MMRKILSSLEAVLLTGGSALALWCGYSWLQIERVARMPVPPPAVIATLSAQTAPVRLPGETAADHAAARPRVAPKLAAGTWLAKLEAPKVHLQATVLEGTDEGTLAKAAGHIEGTALPGPQGNIGIAGHRDTVFRPVRRLDLGDDLILTTADRVYRYRIMRTEIVNPEEVWVLGKMRQPTLTLVTCYPFNAIGHAPKRYIVHGELVGSDPRPPVP